MTPVAEGLWDAAGLIGGRDPASGRVAFPRPDGWDAVGLGRTGTLWSWTVQRFPPKSPPYRGAEPFEAFALGYVELADVIVESRLDGGLDGWRVGDAVELAVVPFGERVTFAFRRAGDPPRNGEGDREAVEGQGEWPQPLAPPLHHPAGGPPPRSGEDLA